MKILNVYVEQHSRSLFWLCVVLFCCFIACFVYRMISRSDTAKTAAWILGFSTLLALTVGILNDTLFQTTTYYECTIDDQYPARDFFEKYELVDRRGELWLLEEKPADSAF